MLADPIMIGKVNQIMGGLALSEINFRIECFFVWATNAAV